MAAASVFSSNKRRITPTLSAFLPPLNSSDEDLFTAVTSASTDFLASFSGKTLPFQVKNSRSLLRKVRVLLILLEYLRDSRISSFPSIVILCLNELQFLLCMSKILLDYCFQSSKLWLLLHNQSISGHFNDLNLEISAVLDVMPLDELSLSEDVMEHVELLRNQSRKEQLFIDEHDESLRLKLFSFLNEFENGKVPDLSELRLLFVKNLGIRNVNCFRAEIEYLEEQIVNRYEVEPTASVLTGFIAIARYCRFLLFKFEDDEIELVVEKEKSLQKRSGMPAQIPKDFCCPISLDLMKDPVIIWSGQTYDRSSITRWMEEGHSTCPKTGQNLAHNKLIPNRALRNLISIWCKCHNHPYDPIPSSESSSDNFPPPAASKAAIEANKATINLLIEQLANGSPSSQAVSALEIRFLARTGKENRSFIAEAGAIPHLKILLSSPYAVTQENSVTALLNLSIHDKNKSRIIGEKGCLESIVNVLRFGHTTEARENAAATLFSLSSVHDYKKLIAEVDGSVEALAKLLKRGTQRGKKDAVTALFNLSTHIDNCARMIESGAVAALVAALNYDGVDEEASGALALIVRRPAGAEAVGKWDLAVSGLINMMKRGSPRGKENAVAALLEVCRSGGAATTQRIVKAPAMPGLIQGILFTGTKRARRKAASLARVFQRCQNSNSSFHLGGISVAYSNTGIDTSFGGELSVRMPISVPVV